MHGVKRSDIVEITEEEKKLKLKKINKYVKLTQTALKCHQNNIYTVESMKLITKLLEINPDYYTMWNFRRKILLHFFKEEPSNIDELRQKDLNMVERALKRNPKSYCAWHHRLWIIDKGDHDQNELDQELQLCSKYLSFDSRNFHCWDYRGFIINRHPNVLLEQEFKFVCDRINADFSNFSAWHYRSVIISKMCEGKSLNQIHNIIDSEFKTVKAAYYTEPEDQSAWLYHRWLVARSIIKEKPSLLLSPSQMYSLMDNSNNNSCKEIISNKDKDDNMTDNNDAVELLKRHRFVLKRELKECLSLLEVEEKCKWALLTSVILMHSLLVYDTVVNDYKEQIKNFLSRLRSLDPLRLSFYNYLETKAMSITND